MIANLSLIPIGDYSDQNWQLQKNHQSPKSPLPHLLTLRLWLIFLSLSPLVTNGLTQSMSLKRAAYFLPLKSLTRSIFSSEQSFWFCLLGLWAYLALYSTSRPLRRSMGHYPRRLMLRPRSLILNWKHVFYRVKNINWVFSKIHGYVYNRKC